MRWTAPILLACLALGPGTAESSSAEPQVAYAIGEGDVLRISAWREPELDRTLPVRPDGRISLPLVGDVEVAGRTPEELKEILRELYREFITEPQLSVTVTEIHSQKFYVLGEVAQPGVYDLEGPTRLLQALAMAGGLTPFARQGQVVILRQHKGWTRRLGVSLRAIASGKKPQMNLLLQAGDTVLVP